MTAPTTAALLPTVGDIHRAGILWHLADGTFRQENRDILIVDATHTTDGGARIVWEIMEGAGVDYLPRADHVFTTTFPALAWPEGAVNWMRRDTATYTLSLLQRVGVYKPRNPNANAIEHLREGALRRLAVQPDRTTGEALRNKIRVLSARLDALPAVRDDLIREALAAGISTAALAEDSGLSTGRIYQIRDGRR